MESKLEEYGPAGLVPEYGAIFMANRETKNECLKMEIFALPSGSAKFVKQVKAGMLLFLFEYEKRQLFGVYQATTDGGINILSQGSCSSLTQYPAQVGFTPVWFCDPLSEKEFQDVIRENYFANGKFNFGLSKDQVHRLLQLFSSRKLKNELQVKQLRGGSEPFHDRRQKLNKKFDEGNLEGRNGSPDLLIKDIGHFADRCKDEDSSYQYLVNVTNNRHNTNTFEQSCLPDNFNGSLSTKSKKEEGDRNLMNLKDHQSDHHDVSGTNFCDKYHMDTLDNNNRRKEDHDRYLMNFRDQRSIHHNVWGEYNGDTFYSNKRTKEEDKFFVNLKDQQSVYQNVPTLNFGPAYRDGILDKNRQPSDCDELVLRGEVQYEDKDSTLGVRKYLPVPNNLRVAGNDMYTFVDKVVADSEQGGCPSSNSPHIRTEPSAFFAKGLSDDKFLMNLGSKTAYELCNSNQDVLLNEITRGPKCSRPEVHYPLDDTKCLMQDMQNMDRLHRPDAYMNFASVDAWKYRPRMNSQLESEHHLGDSLEPGYSYGKFDENTLGNQGVTGYGSDPVMDGRVKAGHLCEAMWFSESYGNSSQSYDSEGYTRRSFDDSQFTTHNQVEGSAAMDSFHNSVRSFGYGAPCQPNEDPLMYSGGSPPGKMNQLSEAQHLIRTYPSYHESLITKSLPCDSGLNFSHPGPSSSHGVFSSSSLLRGIPPYQDSGEPHVSNSRSLLYHPVENHLSQFPCLDSKNKDTLQYSSTLANQDYYHGDTNNCFQNTEAAVNRELENFLPTNCRSQLLAVSPSGNRRLPEDVVYSKEKVGHHASSPHKNSTVNYFDSVHPSSARVSEHIYNKSSTGQFPNVNWSSAGYPGGKNFTNYDSECYTGQGQVMGLGNDNSEHPLDVSGIPKSNRRSVFSRLSSGPEISSQGKLDADRLFNADTTVDDVMDKLLQDTISQLEKRGKRKSKSLAKNDEEKLNNDQILKADASADEMMGMLPKGKKYLVKKPCESRKLTRQPDEGVSKTKKKLSLERPVEHSHPMIDSSEQDHSKIISANLTSYVNLADGECPDGTLRETRLVDFKRRSETKKKLVESTGKRGDEAVDNRTAVEGSMGNKAVDNRTAVDSRKLTPLKRRKLIRPVFVQNKSLAEAKPKMHDPAQTPQSPVRHPITRKVTNKKVI